jgi:hypothetical protein
VTISGGATSLPRQNEAAADGICEVFPGFPFDGFNAYNALS